jgi:hypothetical protein
VTYVVAATHTSLARQGATAGPVVATLALVTLAVVLAVLGLAYVLYLRDRR